GRQHATRRERGGAGPGGAGARPGALGPAPAAPRRTGHDRPTGRAWPPPAWAPGPRGWRRPLNRTLPREVGGVPGEAGGGGWTEQTEQSLPREVGGVPGEAGGGGVDGANGAVSPPRRRGSTRRSRGRGDGRSRRSSLSPREVGPRSRGSTRRSRGRGSTPHHRLAPSSSTSTRAS